MVGAIFSHISMHIISFSQGLSAFHTRVQLHPVYTNTQVSCPPRTTDMVQSSSEGQFPTCVPCSDMIRKQSIWWHSCWKLPRWLQVKHLEVDYTSRSSIKVGGLVIHKMPEIRVPFPAILSSGLLSLLSTLHPDCLPRFLHASIRTTASSRVAGW